MVTGIGDFIGEPEHLSGNYLRMVRKASGQQCPNDANDNIL